MQIVRFRLRFLRVGGWGRLSFYFFVLFFSIIASPTMQHCINALPSPLHGRRDPKWHCTTTTKKLEGENLADSIIPAFGKKVQVQVIG